MKIIRSHNPIDYWKYLKSIDSKSNDDISNLHEFYEHFQEMSNDFNHHMDNQHINDNINIDGDKRV